MSQEKSHENIRKGITNAKLNEGNSKVLFGEIVFIAIIVGLLWKSWWVFGAALIGFIFALQIRIMAIPLMILLSICWGAIGYGIGSLFDSIGASIVLAILGFLVGLGTHLSGLTWVKDIGK